MKSRDSTLRRSAAGTLADLGPHDKATVDALIEALTDSDTYVRQSAVKALGNVKPGDAPRAAAALEHALEEEATSTNRPWVIKSLGKLAPHYPGMVTVITEALQHPEPRVQEAAREQLERLESEDPANGK